MKSYICTIQRKGEKVRRKQHVSAPDIVEAGKAVLKGTDNLWEIVKIKLLSFDG